MGAQRPEQIAAGRMLGALGASSTYWTAVPQEMDAPGLRFHALTGNLAGRYAVTVRANWRITFARGGQDAIEVDYEDYHH